MQTVSWLRYSTCTACQAKVPIYSGFHSDEMVPLLPFPLFLQSSAMASGIQGQLLEITVLGCSRLKDTEWFSRQDPYVCLEYASTKFRTRTCTDGDKDPVFQEKINFPLVEGLREIDVTVWNENTITTDDFIGSGKIMLQNVITTGYDDSPWSLHSKSGRFAGEVKVIMHYRNATAGPAYNRPTEIYEEHSHAHPEPTPTYNSPTDTCGEHSHSPHPRPTPTDPNYPLPDTPYPGVAPYQAPYPADHAMYPPQFPPTMHHSSPTYPPLPTVHQPPLAYPPPPAIHQPYPPQPFPPTEYPPPATYSPPATSPPQPTYPYAPQEHHHLCHSPDCCHPPHHHRHHRHY